MSRPCTSPQEGFRRDHRLCRSADYKVCYTRGRRQHGSYVILYFRSGLTSEARLGITASRRDVGSSVVRKKVKRRVREIFRRWTGRKDLKPMDLVVHLKPGAGAVPFLLLREDLERLFGTLPTSRKRENGSPAAES